MGRNPAGNETDFGQIQKFQHFQRRAQMAVMNGIESPPQHADRARRWRHQARPRSGRRRQARPRSGRRRVNGG